MSHEEKESDVCLSICLLKEAVLNHYDTAFIISGDSDIAPGMRAVKEMYPHKKLKILVPPERNCAFELLQIADQHSKIKKIHIERSLFSDEVQFTHMGKTMTIKKPVSYT